MSLLNILYKLMIISLFLISLVSCNLRENILLPPNISPDNYIESNTISTISNYLVKSTTDNSYLLIDKHAIADSTLHLGDTIIFYKTESLAERDSVHITYQNEISPALNFYIIRDGAYINLILPQNYPYLTYYTDLKSNAHSGHQIYCMNISFWLDGQTTTYNQYAKRRISFHPYGTGINQLYSINNAASTVSFSADAGNHYVWMQGTQDRVSFFLPVPSANTEIDITTVTELDSTSTRKIQGVFPDFALFSSIVNIQSSKVLGNSVSAPLMKLHNNNLSQRFPMQWVVVAQNQLYAWEESAETWMMYGNDLIAPCRVNGSYMLIVPLESQNGFSLPLDAGLKQIYAHKYWFDLSDINLSGVTFSLDFDFTPSAAYQNYFSGQPYTLIGNYNRLKLSFKQNGTELHNLPNENWFEMGFMTESYASDKRWIRFYESTTEDYVSFKTSAEAYDATHYSYADGYVYTSVIGSGDYTFSRLNINESSPEISLLKNYGSLQMNNSYIAWNDFPSGITVNLETDYSETAGYKNYFSGHPYNLTGSADKFRIEFFQNGTKLYDLPSSAWIEYGFVPTAFDEDKRWIRYYESTSLDFVFYKTHAATYDATHYAYTDGFVINSILGSGDYIYSQMNTNDKSVEIPVLKTIGEFHMDNALIVWDNTQAKSKMKRPNIAGKQKIQKTLFSSVVLDFTPPSAASIPWLSGHPYQIQNPHSAINLTFKTNGAATLAVPSYCYLEYNVPSSLISGKAVLYSDINSEYTAMMLNKSNIADYEHFTLSNNRIGCFPAYSGTIVHGDITNLTASNFDIRMYQKMSLDFDRIKIWMNSATTVPEDTNLSFNLTGTFNDPNNILLNQYNLTQTSPAYNISLASSKRNTRAFFDEHKPLLYLKRNSKRNEKLFALIQDYNYRIYPYGQAESPDGWNYAVEGDYNLFYLVHNGQFATFADNDPHLLISQTVTSSTNDMILSLYQAEFFLPSYFYDNATPAGTQVALENIIDFSTMPDAISATKLNITNSVNQPITTNFLSGYITTNYPLLYVPFPNSYAGQNIRLFFKDTAGVTTEYTNVTSFSTYALTEFIVFGNCAICYVNNPGTFYTSVGAK